MNNIGVPNDTSGSGVPISVEPVTSLNGAAVTETHLQRFLWAIRTAAGIAVDLPGDAVNGPRVDVQRLPVAATGTATVTAVTVNAVDGVTIAAAVTRRGLLIWNDSTQTLFGKYASAIPVVAPYSFRIKPDGYWEMPLPIYQGAITGRWGGPEDDPTKTGANVTNIP